MTMVGPSGYATDIMYMLFYIFIFVAGVAFAGLLSYVTGTPQPHCGVCICP
jgi:hypothetical protein